MAQGCKIWHVASSDRLLQNLLHQPITRQQNFRLVQIETNCRQHFKVHLEWKIRTRVENILRKGEIACYKQFFFFSQCFPQLYIFSA